MLVIVQVPVPVFVKPPAPEMVPSKLVLVLLAPELSNAPVLSTKLPPVAPPPAKEPILKLLLSCKIALLVLLNVTAVLLPKALTFEVMTLPLLIAVLPVYALLPLSVNVPPAALTDKPPAPEMRPENVGEIAFNVREPEPVLLNVCRV